MLTEEENRTTEVERPNEEQLLIKEKEGLRLIGITIQDLDEVSRKIMD